MNYRVITRTLGIVIVAFVLGACINPFNSSSSGGGEVGTVSISVGGLSSSTIIPDVAILIDDYRIVLSRDGFDSIETVVSGDTATFSEVPIGTWRVVVEARDAASSVIGVGETEISVGGGAMTEATVTVVPTSNGSGDIFLSVTWPAGEVDGMLAATMTLLGGSAVDISGDLTAITNGVRYNQSIGSGQYTFALTLERGGELVASVVEAVHIYDNVTTLATVPIAAGEIAQAPTAPTGLAASEPVEGSVLLSWTDASNVEDSYSVERAPGSSPGAGDWVLLTDPALAAGTSSYTDSTVEPGTVYSYRVSAINTFGSASATTTITTFSPFLYVSTTGNDVTGTGSSTAPFRSLERALQIASSGQTIRISGTASGSADYPEPLLTWIDGVNLEGAWAPDFSQQNEDLYGNVVILDEASNQISIIDFSGISSAQIGRVTIRNSASLGTINTRYAIRVIGSSPTFTRIVAETQATRIASAVYISGASNPTFTESTLAGGATQRTTGAYSRAIETAANTSGTITVIDSNLQSDYSYITEPIRLINSFAGTFTMTGGTVDMSAAGNPMTGGVYASRGIWHSSGNLVLDGVTFFGAGSIDSPSGEQLISTDMNNAGYSVTVQNSTFRSGFHARATSGPRLYAIDLEIGSAVGDVLIENNVFISTNDADTPSWPISAQGTADNVRINANTITIPANSAPQASYGMWLSFEVPSPHPTGSSDYVVSNNVVVREAGESGSFFGIRIDEDPGAIVANNTIVSLNPASQGGQAYGVYLGDFESPVLGAAIYNNLVWILGHGYGIYESSSGTGDADPIVFEHNFVGEQPDVRTYYVYQDPTGGRSASAAVLADPAYTTGTAATTTGNVTTSGVTPIFVNAGGGNFRLISGNDSQLLVGGLDISLLGITADRDGTTRTADGTTGFSMGAYEYEGSVGLPAGDLLAEWLFPSVRDIPSGIDSSGNDNHLTRTQGTGFAVSDRFGTASSAAGLDSSVSYEIVIEQTTPLDDYLDGQTISFWMPPPTENGRIISRRYGGGSTSWELDYIVGDRFRVSHAGSTQLSVFEPTFDQAWNHVAVVLHPTYIRVYVNGNLEATRSGDYDFSTTNPLRIGSTGLPGISGAIDDVRVFGRVLNSAEIAALVAETQ